MSHPPHYEESFSVKVSSVKIADTKVISVEDLLIGQLTLVREPFLVEQTSHFKFNDFPINMWSILISSI